MSFHYYIKELEQETNIRLCKEKGIYIVSQPILTPEQIKKAAYASINYKSEAWEKYYKFAKDFIEVYESDYNKLKEKEKRFCYFYVYGKMRFYNCDLDKKIINLIQEDTFISSIIGITLKRKKQVCNKIIQRRCSIFDDVITEDIINKLLEFCNKYIFCEKINNEKWENIMIFSQPTPRPKNVKVNLIEGGKISGQREATIYCNKPQPVKVKKVKWLAYLFECLSERGIIIKKWQHFAGRQRLFASKNGTTIKDNSFARNLADYRIRKICKNLNDKRLQENDEIYSIIDEFIKTL